jgi:hypothetical protein
MDWQYQPKKTWQIYNEFCDLLEEMHMGYNSQTYVQEDGLTIFRISCCQKFDGTDRDKTGLEIICRWIAIWPGEMEECIKRAYQSCIDNLLRAKERNEY